MKMLEGALRELAIGDTRALAVDVGPVIDEDARLGIERHIGAMQANGRRVVQHAGAPGATAHGSFVAPTMIEIGRLAELEREVFGPVLHVLRYDREDLAALLGQINATGYGLTLGVHTRIDETVAQVVDAAHAGNIYVTATSSARSSACSRSAARGSLAPGRRPGGPLYLLRLLSARPDDEARAAVVAAGVRPRRRCAGCRWATARATRRCARCAAGRSSSSPRRRPTGSRRSTASPRTRRSAAGAPCPARPARPTST
jgi:RHH-type proline utilization regulon transcriptional repressor/proline dehydrogenase/delta 1-pyrroline-5-carboxylate dehydrogenase